MRTTPWSLLRRPVARSTVAAVLECDVRTRDRVADLTLDWIDALAPVIAARRPPGRWSRVRRTERDARFALEDALAAAAGLASPPPTRPPCWRPACRCRSLRERGSWDGSPSHASAPVDPVHAVWETLRLTPPTWITARITTEPVDLDGTEVPAGRVVLVSPLLLGRLPELVPGGPDQLAGFDPARWQDPSRRPGAWLPFGAGPHACPGRTLGLAQLVHLATWANQPRADAQRARGNRPEPGHRTATVAVHRRRRREG